MNKSEFMNAIKPCKKCGTKRTVSCDLGLNPATLSPHCVIRCLRCGEVQEGDDISLVLATWNAKNHDNSKRYVVVIQNTKNPFYIKVLDVKVENESEISEIVAKDYENYEIISKKEI